MLVGGFDQGNLPLGVNVLCLRHHELHPAVIPISAVMKITTEPTSSA